MEHTTIDKAALEEKSKELGIPFPNLTEAFILESFLCLLADSVFRDSLWIKNPHIFGLEQYREKNAMVLHISYLLDQAVIKAQEFKLGQKLSLKMQYVMLAAILNVEKFPEIQWRGRPVQKEGSVEFEITGTFGETTIPLRMIVTELEHVCVKPIKKELPYFMDPNQVISYLEYPTEPLLAEQLFYMIQNMDTMPMMYPYDIIYHILADKIINGRHICKIIKELCVKAGMQFNGDSMELDETDETDETDGSDDIDSLMEHRWNLYLAQDRREGPSWQDVENKISKFLPDIWQAVCCDELFFGDWMPELERFLG